ncbi:inositol monophosphatase family protein [Caryophanon latum]|uniref:Inositol phosphatase n=1 Tax=Caryophanon latum TaxID=33977 RepID=A0A1C0YZP5_9BACL|nr:inositol monophosphatase family protein [Caryophanon latum]OCS92632.1 inositol phosphatase [Caryophanon latum]
MEEILHKAKTVATKLVIEAGAIAKERFDQFTRLEEKDDYGDLITEVDTLAEQLILTELTNIFPDHQIHSEEAGDNGKQSDWLWQVDPLDGTNNFAIGLPVFSSSLTLLYKREPVLGAIYEPMVNRLFISSVNEGSFCNDVQLTMNKKATPEKSTIAWIQGHSIQNDEKAVKLRRYIDVNCKRMMRLWAPTLQWCMLSKGAIDAIILYNSEGDDLYSGILMVKEAGGIVVDFEGNDFTGMNDEPYLVACHPDHKEYFLEMVNEGLK